MTQAERRIYLIKELLNEQPQYRNMNIPENSEEQRRLLRSLMNVRLAAPITDEFAAIQDEYLSEELDRKGITDIKELTPLKDGIYVWQGDITRLRAGAIVNAANSGMTGCYQPCHACIDNCIHTYAGIQLRNYCNELMEKQGFAEPTGQAKITPAYNLPCDYVIHTVGPIVQGKLNDRHRQMLKSCYESCLDIAVENDVKSIAFCCISTGVFMFPNEEAARIAVETVYEYRQRTGSKIEVVFNVFKDYDKEIYEKLLG